MTSGEPSTDPAGAQPADSAATGDTSREQTPRSGSAADPAWQNAGQTQEGQQRFPAAASWGDSPAGGMPTSSGPGAGPGQPHPAAFRPVQPYGQQPYGQQPYGQQPAGQQPQFPSHVQGVGQPPPAYGQPWHGGPHTASMPQVGPGGPYPGYAIPGQHGMPGAAPGMPRQRPGNRVTKAVFATLLALLIAIAGGVVGGILVSGSSPSAQPTADGAVSRTGGDGSLADVAAEVQPSVVSIQVSVGSQQGTGSGVVVTRSGLVLTNNHVVGDADEIQVRFQNGQRETAELVETNPDMDLAVVRIKGADQFKPAKVGDSETLRVGDTVIAIGSPLGLDGSVTAGIVSGLKRTIPAREGSGADRGAIEGVIQTDAAINPGNSGGPLLNAAGEVVGINTAIATTSERGGNIGLGFAVPVNAAKQLLADAQD